MTDDDESLTASDVERAMACERDVCITWLVVASATISSSYSPEELVKPKDPNESADEQQRATKGNNNLADKKTEWKWKREKSTSSAGNTCKKSKVS